METQKRLLTRTIVTVCALIFLSLLAIPSPEAQAKPKEFVIGVIADLTGPYAAVVAPLVPGLKTPSNMLTRMGALTASRSRPISGTTRGK